MGVALQQDGRRIYITGDTYSLKDRIKGMGGHWDGDRRCWWVGSAKKSEAEALVSTAASTPAQPKEEKPDDIRIVGKARYKGRNYYVRWYGQTKRGYACRLVTLDAKIDFWATCAEPYVNDRDHDGSGDVAVIVKTYEPREYRGRYEYMTLGSMRRFMEEVKRDKETGTCSLCESREARGHSKAYFGSGDYDYCPRCGAIYGEV